MLLFHCKLQKNDILIHEVARQQFLFQIFVLSISEFQRLSPSGILMHQLTLWSNFLDYLQLANDPELTHSDRWRFETNLFKIYVSF